jgi:hypothetical protein
MLLLALVFTGCSIAPGAVLLAFNTSCQHACAREQQQSAVVPDEDGLFKLPLLQAVLTLLCPYAC